MAVSVSYYTVRRSDRQWTFFFYLRSDGQYVLISDAIMAMFLLIIILCDVRKDSDGSFLLKVRWTTNYI